jgi:O-antigen/teichoic acid export membrane protein
MASAEEEGGREDLTSSASDSEIAGRDPERMDLGGAGHNFLWTAVAAVLTMAGGIFLLSFSIRRVGRIEYGAIVTISSATSILTVFFFGLRYAVMRSGAKSSLLGRSVAESSDAEAIQATHILFLFGALGLALIGAVFGWLIPLDLGVHGSTALQIYFATVIAFSGSALLLAVTSFSGILASQEMFALLAKIGIAGFACQVLLTIMLAKPLHVVGLAIAIFGSSLLQAMAFFYFGRRRASWLRMKPRWPKSTVIFPILRYASGIALLSATSTICAASDAFVLGAFGGGGFVTVFRVGSVAPLSLVTVVALSYGVLFPRLVRTADQDVQEEGIGWLGRIIGWGSGAAFGCLCLVGADLVRIFYGRSDSQSLHVMWICAAALCLDASYHGVVQVVFARGQQSLMAKYTWIELILNLTVTVIGVKLYGPLGSALALAITVVVTDIIGFPIIMRGRWGSPAGRFVLLHGVLQSIAGGAIVVAIGVIPVISTTGLLSHAAFAIAGLIVSIAIGFVMLGKVGRSRTLSFFANRPNGSGDFAERA